LQGWEKLPGGEDDKEGVGQGGQEPAHGGGSTGLQAERPRAQALVLGEGAQLVEQRALGESRLKGLRDKTEQVLRWRA